MELKAEWGCILLAAVSLVLQPHYIDGFAPTLEIDITTSTTTSLEGDHPMR
jgi:hypothetical protein